MVKLSDFIGELVADIADARKVVDKNSVVLSQSYSVDPFLKGMAIPHYTIEEAEIKMPVSVVGVESDKMEIEKNTASILASIKKKLPPILLDSLKNYYIEREQKNRLKEKEEQTANDVILKPENPDAEAVLDKNEIIISEQLTKVFAKLSAIISQNINEPMKSYLELVNFEFIKLLDIRDEFQIILEQETRKALSGIENNYLPITEENINVFSSDVSNKMFNEFRRAFNFNKGIYIEPTTGKMNEYSTADYLMNITVKIKEQDLNVLVDGEDSNTGNRFLSLS